MSAADRPRTRLHAVSQLGLRLLPFRKRLLSSVFRHDQGTFSHRITPFPKRSETPVVGVGMRKSERNLTPREEISARLTELRSKAESHRGGREYTWDKLTAAVNDKIREGSDLDAAGRGQLPSKSTEVREPVNKGAVGNWIRRGDPATHFYQLWALVLVLHADAGSKPPLTKYVEWETLWKQARNTPRPSTLQTDMRSGRFGGQARVWMAVAGVVALVGAGLIYWLNTDSASSSPLARTYDPHSPVVVQGIRTTRDSLDFVLADKLTLGTEDLRTLSEEATRGTGANQARFDQQHDTIPLTYNTVIMTVSTNLDQPVTITGLRALKECTDPFGGTFFSEYSQGGSTPNVKLGIDLDSPDPQARYTDEHMAPTGPPFFTKENIQLKPGDSTTLSLEAVTKKYGCSFKLELTVDTPTGQVTQIVDHSGKPFKVTAKAEPKKPSFPLSGYQAAYVQQIGYVWQTVNPSEYRGR
ncbi:hypothetical protein ACFV4K_34145 [Nocardia sp. NPDC059764]|uniref:hypothetical protein n=1 Tax=Nocardia sp. NPDC059764 TaxID=3346939 RepID=UPI0036655A88